MYSTSLSNTVEQIFADLRKKAERIIAQSASATDAKKRIVQSVASETSSRSKSILSDMLFDLSDKLMETAYFHDVSVRNKFVEMNLRQEIMDKYRFSSEEISYKEISKAKSAFLVGGTILVVGGIGEVSYILTKGLSVPNLVPIPIGILVGAALSAALADYLLIEPSRSKKKFKAAVDQYLEDTQAQFLQWFDDVETYFNKRVEDFKKAN